MSGNSKIIHYWIHLLLQTGDGQPGSGWIGLHRFSDAIDITRWVEDNSALGPWRPFSPSTSDTVYSRVTVGSDGLWYTYNSSQSDTAAAFWCVTEPVCEFYSK